MRLVSRKKCWGMAESVTDGVMPYWPIPVTDPSEA
jgi:hypothetical protein